MSFWGLSRTGKDDQGRLGELPRWGKANMEQNLTLRNANQEQGGTDQNTYRQFLQDRLKNGFGTPSDIRKWGTEALPGAQDAVARSRAAYAGVQTPQQTNDQITQNLDTNQDFTNTHDQALKGINLQNYQRQSGLVNDNANTNTGLINSVYPSMMQGVNDTYGYLRKLNGTTSDDLLSRNASTFGGLRDKNQTVYDDLMAKTGNAYSDAGANINRLSDDTTAAYGRAQDNTAAQRAATAGAFASSRKNLDRMIPGGDLMAANLARSFAPNIAATNRRLIASGIDPNSAEGSSQIQAVEASRGHAMDDLLGANSKDYINSQNEMTLGNEAAQTSLGRDQNALTLGEDQTQIGLGKDFNNLLLGGSAAHNTLAEGQFGNESALAQGEGSVDRGILKDQFANETGLAQTQGSSIRQYQQALQQALTSENNKNTGLRLGLDQNYGNNDSTIADTTYQRTMGIQKQRADAITEMRKMGLQDADIQQRLEQMGLNVTNQEFQTGMQGVGANVQQQNVGGQGMGTLAQFLQQLAMQQDASGRAWNGQSFDQTSTDLGVESANAGWGTKLLMSMLGPALGMINPAAGMAVSQITPAVAGGVTGTPSFTPAGGSSNGMGSFMSFIQQLMGGGPKASGPTTGFGDYGYQP